MRRQLALGLALALAACGKNHSSPGGDDDAPSACPSAIQLVGDAVPGRDVIARLVDDGGQPVDTDATWTVSAGTLAAAVGTQAMWTLPDTGPHLPGTAHISASLAGTPCATATVDLDVKVEWPDRLRVVVLYDPAVDGSEQVARHYTAFRNIPDDQLCAVTGDNLDLETDASWSGFVDQVLACVDALGPRIYYLAPVYGVPYKVTRPFGGATMDVALDSMLAYGHGAKTGAVENTFSPYYQYSTSGTGTYPDHVSFEAWKAGATTDALLVTRLDGSDAAAAMALIDRTAIADQLANGCQLAGTIYVDGNRGLPHPADDGGYDQGEWNIAGVETVFTAYNAAHAHMFPIVADYNGEEFGTAPAPLTAPDALYYAGWYSFGHYNDVFTWNPGAIGAHLDSCSACDIRGMTDWSAVALQRGITATFGAVNEPYVQGLPDYDMFFHLLLQGASFAEAGYESEAWAGWMVVWLGDPIYRPHAIACP